MARGEGACDELGWGSGTRASPQLARCEELRDEVFENYVATREKMSDPAGLISKKKKKNHNGANQPVEHLQPLRDSDDFKLQNILMLARHYQFISIKMELLCFCLQTAPQA